MIAGDPTYDVIEALKAYFSLPIARALVLSTVRRTKLDGAPLPPHAIAKVVTALEHALPMYIADASRRGECIGRLMKLVPKSGSPKWQRRDRPMARGRRRGRQRRRGLRSLRR